MVSHTKTRSIPKQFRLCDAIQLKATQKLSSINNSPRAKKIQLEHFMMTKTECGVRVRHSTLINKILCVCVVSKLCIPFLIDCYHVSMVKQFARHFLKYCPLILLPVRYHRWVRAIQFHCLGRGTIDLWPERCLLR